MAKAVNCENGEDGVRSSALDQAQRSPLKASAKKLGSSSSWTRKKRGRCSPGKSHGLKEFKRVSILGCREAIGEAPVRKIVVSLLYDAATLSDCEFSGEYVGFVTAH